MQNKNLFKFPKARVPRSWFRQFNDKKHFHNDGTLQGAILRKEKQMKKLKSTVSMLLALVLHKDALQEMWNTQEFKKLPPLEYQHKCQIQLSGGRGTAFATFVGSGIHHCISN